MEDRHVSTGLTYARFSYSHNPRLNFTPARSHLNLIRSVTTILEITNKAIKEQQDGRPQSQQRSFSPSLLLSDRKHSVDMARDPGFNFSEKHKLLQLRLKPLTHVQRDLEEYLGSALEPDQVAAAFHTAFPSPDAESSRGPRRHMGFSTSGNSPWRTRFSSESRRSTERKSIQDLHDSMEVFYCCRSDIKQLWADDVVRQVLKRVEPPLEHLEL